MAQPFEEAMRDMVENRDQSTFCGQFNQSLIDAKLAKESHDTSGSTDSIATVGSLVTLTGLVSNADLNGKQGFVHKLLGNGRLKINVGTSDYPSYVSVKPKNVIVKPSLGNVTIKPLLEGKNGVRVFVGSTVTLTDLVFLEKMVNGQKGFVESILPNNRLEVNIGTKEKPSIIFVGSKNVIVDRDETMEEDW
eukprot:m.110415 g.110415  ORF g.110415 m.110415 type:complete len:192 (+) comp28037_c0_seq1:304-879(+)